MKIPELSNLDFGLVWAAHNLIRGRMLCRIGLAQSGHRLLHCTCPLSGVKRTWRVQCEMSAYDAVDGASSAASKCYRLVSSKRKQASARQMRPIDGTARGSTGAADFRTTYANHVSGGPTRPWRKNDTADTTIATNGRQTPLSPTAGPRRFMPAASAANGTLAVAASYRIQRSP